MANLVENIEQVIENIKTMEHYLHSDIKEEQEFAFELVKKGRAMIVYRVNGKNHFAPVRFVGFRKNNRVNYFENEKKEKKDAAPVLQALFGTSFTHAAIEKEFNDYASTLPGSTLKSRRKYWRVRGEDNKYFDLELATVESAMES